MSIWGEETEVIFHTRRSLLFDSGKTWMKRNGARLFDVNMGSFDGAEVCLLVGIFVLQKNYLTFTVRRTLASTVTTVSQSLEPPQVGNQTAKKGNGQII